MTNIIIIACVSILFFWRTINYQYVSDDIPTYLATKNFHKDCWWKRWFYSIEGSIKTNQKQDHIITLILHTLVCIMIYVAFGMNNISFLAAFLFMVNPTNNQGSIWVSARGYVLPTLFLLCAMACWYASPIFLYAATYFHTGFLSPIIFIFSPLFIILVPMPIIWLLHLKRFKALVSQKVKKEMYDEDRKIHPNKLILYFKTFGYYLTLCIFPFRTTFYHSFMQSMAGNIIMKKRAYKIDKFFFVGLIAFSAFVYYIATHRNMISFGLVWFMWTLLPYCNLRRIHQEIAERYCYLPMVGLMYVLASIIVNLEASSGYCGVLCTLFLTLYATKLWFYMPAYKDDYFLGEVSCLNSPDAWFSWHVRAMRRWETGAYKEALTLWVMAKLISPLEFKILFNLATILRMVKNYKESDEFFEMAMQNIPAGQEDEIAKIAHSWKKGNMAILL